MNAPEVDIPDVPPTIAQLPFFTRGRFLKPDMLGQVTGASVSTMNGRELVDRVRDISLGLSALGMQAGDRVAILSESRLEWLLIDLSIVVAGAVTVPIYPTLAVAQVEAILRDSGASLVVVSTTDQLDKVRRVAAGLPQLRQVVTMEAGRPTADAGPPVETLDEVGALGHRRIMDGWGVAKEFHDAAKRVRPDDPATIIYTSGTTGEPKGVVLTHANLVANIAGVRQVLDLNPADTALSYLPLCHGFERLVSYVFLTTGVTMIFAESIETLARDLKLVRPTVMSGVPRVFEKLRARVLERGQAQPGVARWIFNWAVGVAGAKGRRLASGRSLSPFLSLQARLADRLVFRKVLDGVGGRLRFTVSGSAPLRAEVGEFFYGLGVPILEGYGLTETAPVLTVTPLDGVRFGAVGRPLPNVELRIADDGEVLARGPNVMAGYHKRPDETAACLADGWFATGDIGQIDDEGYLRITDRKKDLLVTSGGKKIAPQPIETALRSHALVAEAVLVGDGRKFPAALLVPDFPELGRQLGLAGVLDEDTARALLDRADVRVLFERAIDRLNEDLAQFERIKRFVLLGRELSVAAGELTPTLKVKRRVIDERYRDLIDAMYREGGAAGL